MFKTEDFKMLVSSAFCNLTHSSRCFSSLSASFSTSF